MTARERQRDSRWSRRTEVFSGGRASSLRPERSSNSSAGRRVARGVTDARWWEERAAFWEEYFDPERFRAISAVYEAGGFDEPLDTFEFGLQRILDGIEALLATR